MLFEIVYTLLFFMAFLQSKRIVFKLYAVVLACVCILWTIPIHHKYEFLPLLLMSCTCAAGVMVSYFTFIFKAQFKDLSIA